VARGGGNAAGAANRANATGRASLKPASAQGGQRKSWIGDNPFTAGAHGAARDATRARPQSAAGDNLQGRAPLVRRPLVRAFSPELNP